MIFRILIANIEFVDEVRQIRYIISKSFMEKKWPLNSVHGKSLFWPSASICGRISTCNLATGLLPARYEARVAEQGISLGTGMLPAEKTFEVALNAIVLQMHLKAKEAIKYRQEVLCLKQYAKHNENEGGA